MTRVVSADASVLKRSRFCGHSGVSLVKSGRSLASSESTPLTESTRASASSGPASCWTRRSCSTRRSSPSHQPALSACVRLLRAVYWTPERHRRLSKEAITLPNTLAPTTPHHIRRAFASASRSGSSTRATSCSPTSAAARSSRRTGGWPGRALPARSCLLRATCATSRWLCTPHNRRGRPLLRVSGPSHVRGVLLGDLRRNRLSRNLPATHPGREAGSHGRTAPRRRLVLEDRWPHRSDARDAIVCASCAPR